MKPESLRIGNIVNVVRCNEQYRHPPRLGTRELSGYDLFHIEMANLVVEPISITESMLLRSNMDQNKDYENRFTIHDKENHRRNSGRWVTRRFLDLPLDTPFMRFDGLCDCYYWHELQNLFFCLSGGKELTLKEE